METAAKSDFRQIADMEHNKISIDLTNIQGLRFEVEDEQRSLRELFLGNEVSEKIMRVASRAPPLEGHFPHHTDGGGRSYNYEPSEWWTSGFFPGSIWQLYRLSSKRPLTVKPDVILEKALFWQKGLEREQFNTETHDLGFMIMPAFYSDFLLRGSSRSRDIIVQAARSLSSRWSDAVQCIRSWDRCVSKRFNLVDPKSDFLVIIDNMMNLDLLYIASEITGDPEFARKATAHAVKTLQHHIRPDSSTYHLVNYDPDTGAPKGHYTVQGYADESCWSRGQAWALYGFATVYRFTGDARFIQASIRLAQYFCLRVNENSSNDAIEDGAVLWDFDAPRPPNLLDNSAAMIACSGMLLIYQLTGDAQFLPVVFKILANCRRNSLTAVGSDAILDHATVNNNGDAINLVRDTGLVYADYFFLETGNRLVDMGLI